MHLLCKVTKVNNKVTESRDTTILVERKESGNEISKINYQSMKSVFT